MGYIGHVGKMSVSGYTQKVGIKWGHIGHVGKMSVAGYTQKVGIKWGILVMWARCQLLDIHKRLALSGVYWSCGQDVSCWIYTKGWH